MVTQQDAALEEEEEFSDEDDDEIPYPSKNVFFVSEIKVRDLPVGKGLPTKVRCCDSAAAAAPADAGCC